MSALAAIVDTERYPLTAPPFQAACRQTLAETGALVLPAFLLPEATERIRREGEAKQDLAYFCSQSYNVFLKAPNPDHPDDQLCNRQG